MLRISSSQKITLVVSLGSALEYYDFVVYGMMSQYLSKVFFVDKGGLSPILLTLSIFAVGYIARPLGGTIAGIIGDMYGRQKVFLFLTTLMACSTLAIGLLPDYSSVGVLSAMLLTLCRVVQGISFGGELAGATTIVGEFGNQGSRSSKMSYILSSTAIGAISATFTLYLLTKFLSHELIMDWGWRIPFLVGGMLGGILWYMRKDIVESPAFNKNSNIITTNLKDFFLKVKEYRMQLPLGMFLTCFVSSLVLLNLYFPFYIGEILKIDVHLVYQSITVSLVFSGLIMPVVGKIADNFSKISMGLLITFLYIFLNIPMFFLITKGSLYTLICYMILHQLFIAAYSVCYFPILFELFPVNIRYTGVALCYNVVYALMGFLPATLTFFITQYESPLVLPYVMSSICFLSLCALCFIKYRNYKGTHFEKVYKI